MRISTKATIMAAFAGPAIAALILTGAGPANAAVTTTTAHTTSTAANQPVCNPFQREVWNLNGSNTVDATYNGGNFNYPVTFRQTGSCLRGTLSDPYYPTSGPIYGTVFGKYVTFSFRYPYGSVQGTRTFRGTINRWGAVSGTWSETGSEKGYGDWSLAKPAHHACRPFYWWNPNRACYVFP
jgi:hypothetical protein